MKKVLAAAVIAILLAPTMFAKAGLAGKWEGKTPNGFTIVLDLTVSKNVLKGTLTRNKKPSPITDGKVTKDTFTFKAATEDQPEAFSGKVNGDDEITIWLDRQGAERGIVLKRVKS